MFSFQIKMCNFSAWW